MLRQTAGLPVREPLRAVQHLGIFPVHVRVARIGPAGNQFGAVLFPLPQLFAERGMRVDDEPAGGFFIERMRGEIEVHVAPG